MANNTAAFQRAPSHPAPSSILKNDPDGHADSGFGRTQSLDLSKALPLSVDALYNQVIRGVCPDLRLAS
jgi:hypothetical protein